MKGLKEHKYLLGENKLLPCPFCGRDPDIYSCDRLIDIGCDACGYHRSFHGLVQLEIETAVVASYKKGTKEPIEWYDKDAYQKAANAWNTRAEMDEVEE